MADSKSVLEKFGKCPDCQARLRFCLIWIIARDTLSEQFAEGLGKLECHVCGYERCAPLQVTASTLSSWSEDVSPLFSKSLSKPSSKATRKEKPKTFGELYAEMRSGKNTGKFYTSKIRRKK